MNELERFRKFLKSKGLKITPERETVFDEVLSSGDHFEAEDLLFRLKNKDQRISKATIYRTLPLLIEGGWLRKVIFDERHMHYERDSGVRQHEHLVCANCGEIIEFSDKKIQGQLDAICQKYRFEPRSHRLEVMGFCKKCQ
jgi:Fur family ferric uptake transcriptional regulator